MDRLLLANLGVLLALIPLGVGLAWALLRGVDKLNGVSFGKDVMPVITQSPIATALYYGIRFASVLALVGVLVGRFV